MEIISKALAGNLIACLLTFGPLLVTLRPAFVRIAALATGLVLLDTVCVYLPTLLGARGMTWAWCGKALEVVVFTVVALRFSRGRLPGDDTEGSPCGLARPTGAWFPALLVGAASAAITVLFGQREEWHAPTAGFLLYEAVMPGPAEELVYRGVLLAVLDAQLGRPLKLLGVHWGVGALLTTVMFFFAHTLSFDNTWRLQIDYGPALEFAYFGLAMCWLRYRFESIWPAALAHNVGNVIPPLL